MLSGIDAKPLTNKIFSSSRIGQHDYTVEGVAKSILG